MGHEPMDSAIEGSFPTDRGGELEQPMDIDDEMSRSSSDFAHNDISSTSPNPFGILAEFCSIIEARYALTHSKQAATTVDILYANKLFDNFLTLLDEYAVEEDEEIFLPCTNVAEDLPETADAYDFSEDSDEENETDDDLYVPSSQSRKRVAIGEPTIERKLQIVEAAHQNPTWSWETLRKKKKFSEITGRHSLPKFRRQIAKGTRIEKYRQINKHTLAQIQEARKTHKILRASHIRTFALQKYIEMNDPSFTFKASKGWLSKFKKRFKISSRQITRLVSKREIRDETQIQAAAKSFQEDIINTSASYDPDQVFNTDQCGFQYEITSARTYTFKGEKQVFGYAQSPKNLCTHSYTVQYIISMAGFIKGNVFVCLQESTGKLGPRVKQEVEAYLPPNVTLTCSSSGKMNTSLNEYFIQKQMVPIVEKDFMCLVDSWGGHKDLASYSKFFGKRNKMPEINLKIIPEKCTPFVQPLDTYFHRQLKLLAREILAALEVFINLHGNNSNTDWNTRKGVIKLQSLLHFQLIAPIFQPMIRYCWYSAGLITVKEQFLNVKEVCFTFCNSDSLVCQVTDCEQQRFIKCSHCRKCICLHHLWVENHFNSCENSPFHT